MIYVSKEQLKQVEYLIGQSIQGNHILFDPETVRWAFENTPKEEAPQILADGEACYAVEHHIEQLIIQPSLAQKRAYLEKLDPATFSQVVRTYFNIVENNLYESQEVRH